MLDPDIQTLVHMGDIIGAIGLYQQRHGGSTLVARKAIDQARRELSQDTTPGSPMPQPPAPAPQMTIINDSELDAALRSGQKISAIKRYRELHGTGLKEAKDAVEAMLEGRPVEHPPQVTPEPEAQLQPELDRLIAAGPKIMAIKHHRAITGLGLKESKDAVEARIAELEGGAVSSPQAEAQPAPGLQPELDRLIAANQKIMAIKHYRTVTNVGLKEAKDAVEARIAELG